MRNLKKHLVSLAIGSSLAVASLGAVANEFATAEELGLMQGFPPAAEKLVDKSNALFTPPFNRWSYLNMRSIYPSVGIENAAQAVKIPEKMVLSIGWLCVVKAELDWLANDQNVVMKT